MSVRLNDSSSTAELRLWNIRSIRPDVSVSEGVLSPVGVSPEETILEVFQESERIVATGVAVGQQLIDEGYANTSDPVTAAAQYALNLEAWVNTSPVNDPIELVNDLSGRTVSVTPSSMSWEQGDPASVDWTLTLEAGGGAGGNDTGISPRTANPGGADTFDGVVLPNIRERRVERSIQLDTVEKYLNESPEDNIQIVRSGVTRRITLLGRFDDDAAAQETFAGQLRQRSGVGSEYTYESAWPGTSLSTAIWSFGSERFGGRLDGEYSLELITGRVI